MKMRLLEEFSYPEYYLDLFPNFYDFFLWPGPVHIKISVFKHFHSIFSCAQKNMELNIFQLENIIKE